MSKITVWTSKGKWSEEVTGCDKIHLMKHAIKKEAEKFRDAPKSKKGGELEITDVERCLLCHKDGTTAYFTKHWSGIQIDNKRIDLSNILDYYNNIDNDKLNEYIREQKFSHANFFTIKLSTLKEMAEEEKTMTKLYEQLIKLAEVPEKGVERLMFMFEEE